MPRCNATLLDGGAGTTDCEVDHFQHIKNRDGVVHWMQGHSSHDTRNFHRQTLIANVSLVTPVRIGDVDSLVTNLSDEVMQKMLGAPFSQ